MRTGSTAFLVDTNVLVYAYDSADLVKQGRAISLLALLAANQRGAFSAQVLGEFFTTATRRITPPLTPAQAELEIVHLIRSWTVFEISDASVMEAVRIVQRASISYWDALIVATARLNRVPIVLTEDLTDGSLG
jgi:predicted nucleic acid-binding protein